MGLLAEVFVVWSNGSSVLELFSDLQFVCRRMNYTLVIIIRA